MEVRAATPADHEQVMGLLAASLGWLPDEHLEPFYRWKHEQSSFGTSPSWVATEDDQVVGFRTFLRWEHLAPDGTVLRAVRAVDTATRPSHQGRGIFRRLTLHGLDELHADGVDLVFNTPNSQSRPGYLRMGWTLVGRLPVSVRLVSAQAPLRMARSRVAADRWSVATAVADDAAAVLADPKVADLLRAAPSPAAIRTNRTVAHLRWRYGFPPLAYRAVALAGDVAQGVAVFRLRRRGAALECALCDVVVPDGDARADRALVRTVARQCGADYVIRLGGPPVSSTGFVRLPRQGPILTARPLGSSVPLSRVDRWDLRLGDVELF